MMRGFEGGGFDGGLMFVFGLHGVFMVVTLLAIIFLVMWAYKALDKKELKKWTKWLFIVGLIGCVMTAAGAFMGMRGGFGDDDFGKGKFEKGGCPFADDVKAPAGTVATPAVKAVK